MRKTQPITDVERLSELVKLAVDEARKLDPDAYFPNAAKWHEPMGESEGNGVRCHVCLGGAVIAGRGLADDFEDVTPGMVAAKESRGDMTRNDAIYNRLVALDSVRQGLYHSAARWFQPDPSIALDSRSATRSTAFSRHSTATFAVGTLSGCSSTTLSSALSRRCRRPASDVAAQHSGPGSR